MNLVVQDNRSNTLKREQETVANGVIDQWGRRFTYVGVRPVGPGGNPIPWVAAGFAIALGFLLLTIPALAAAFWLAYYYLWPFFYGM